jgi:hypothetical protein
VAIGASDIAAPGTAWIEVKNPGPGGGNSNLAFLLVTRPDSSLAFNMSSFAAGNAPERLVIADFNGDGILDVATADEIDNTVAVVLGKGDGTFQPAITYPAGGQPFAIAAGDFNSDGKLDLAVTNICPSYPNCSGATVSIMLGNGDGTFQSQVQYPTGKGPDAVSVGDFNRDGKLARVVTVADEDSTHCSQGPFKLYVNIAHACPPHPLGSRYLDLLFHLKRTLYRERLSNRASPEYRKACGGSGSH